LLYSQLSCAASSLSSCACAQLLLNLLVSISQRQSLRSKTSIAHSQIYISFELRFFSTQKMSESHFDQYEHYNFDQDKSMYSGRSGKQRTKKVKIRFFIQLDWYWSCVFLKKGGRNEYQSSQSWRPWAQNCCQTSKFWGQSKSCQHQILDYSGFFWL